MEDHSDPHDSNHPKPQNAAVAILQKPNRENSARTQTAQERKTMEKLLVLLRTFKPVPFKPAKDLNFTRHATLLRRLGLWDFVHVEFDSTFRGDLVAQLIASYAPNLRCGYVNGVRVSVNKAQFGRALNLQGEVVVEKVLDGLDLVESIGFVEEFVWNWIVLNDDDDACEVPNEVLGCEKLIKEGFLEKVDWLGLMWSMVEKELKAPRLVNCYYASHLNRLIKMQHEKLLLEEVEDESGEVKIGGVVDGVDDCNVELSLGQYNVEKVEVEKEQVEGEQGMDCELNKEEPMQWVLGLKSGAEEYFLRLCNINDVKGFDCVQNKDEEGEGAKTQEEEKEKEEDEHEGHIHAMEAMPCSYRIDLSGNSTGDEYEGHTMPNPISYEIDLSGNSAGEEDAEDKHEGYNNAMEAKPMPFSSRIDLSGNSAGEEEHEGYNYAMEANPMPLSSRIDLSGNSTGDEYEGHTMPNPISYEIDEIDLSGNSAGEEDAEEDKHEGYNNAMEAKPMPFSSRVDLSGNSAGEEEHEGYNYAMEANPMPLSSRIDLSGNSSGEEDAEDEHEGYNYAKESMPMPFSSGFDLSGNSAEDFICSIDDPQMISGVQSLFGNRHKRKFGLDDHNSHLSLNESNKRLRSENLWNSEPVDFDMCMDQMQHWMGKARLMYQTKDQSCEESKMNEQLLLDEIQKRDNMIEHLQKEKVDENQKIYRLEKELYMMSNLLEGYRKAIRETQKAFAEYRARCPQADEPFYKDVPGSGGLVLSVAELEKECLKQKGEESMNGSVIEKKSRDFERGWM